VAEALMSDLGTAQTIYCPAFPENGRAIFMGNLFVGKLPLAESPMKDHPLTPMRDSNLMRLLAPQVTGRVGLIDRLVVARGAQAVRARLGQLADEGIAHVVVDAVADEDLGVIADACRDMPLMTGGSAIAMPLPAFYRDAGLMPEDQDRGAEVTTTAARGVVLSGSCSAMTRAQVGLYLQQAKGFRLDPLRLATDGYGAALDWLEAQPLDRMPLIYATAEPTEVAAAQSELGAARAGEIVEEALAALAVAARDRGAERFVVAGGETSGAVTKALGVTRLEIGPEIAPGVPWTFTESGGRRIALTLKSGNFGSEDFFVRAIDILDKR
jgi:uncharacterized protein YgbK (DUF1537 family)